MTSQSEETQVVEPQPDETQVVEPQQAAQPRGKIIVVASPKGGVGKSTVATNVAILLAMRAPLQTVLVDLDLQFGDVTTLLDMAPAQGISDAASSGVNDSMLLKTFLAPHPSSRLLVLGGVDSPMAGDLVGDEQAGAVLELLAAEFRYVVVDTASGLTDHALAALEAADDVILVSNMSVSSIRALRKECDLLDAIGLSARRHFVLNFIDRSSGLTVKDAEGVLGSPIEVVLPRADDATLAGNQGQPVVLRKKPGEIGKRLAELADRLQSRAFVAANANDPKSRKKRA